MTWFSALFFSGLSVLTKVFREAFNLSMAHLVQRLKPDHLARYCMVGSHALIPAEAEARPQST